MMIVINKIDNILRKLFVTKGYFISKEGATRFVQEGNYLHILEDADQLKVAENPDSEYALDKDLAVAAAGGTQGAATALTKYFNKVTSSTAGTADGVIFPAALIDKVLVVHNTSAATVKAYPAVGETIDDIAANAPFSVAAGTMVYFASLEDGKWQSL
jgi:hypothetical protein